MSRPLLLPGELTEGQFALAQDFCRLVSRTRERLTDAAFKLEAAGLKVSHADVERLYWQLVDLDQPMQQKMLDHIAACVDKQRAREVACNKCGATWQPHMCKP